MEYLSSLPPGVASPFGDHYDGKKGCFYSRWTWTVPLDAKAGERYEIKADVRDASGKVCIDVPPVKVEEAAALGRFIAEVRDGSRWVLMSFNRNGEKRVLLTTNPNAEEIRPSISGSKLAFIVRDIRSPDEQKRYLKIRDLESGEEHIAVKGAANYTSVSISPKGDWISYRIANSDISSGKGTLYIQPLDRDFKAVAGKKFVHQQNFLGDPKGTGLVEPERTGWYQTADQSYALWANAYPDMKYDGIPLGSVIELGRLDRTNAVPVVPAGATIDSEVSFFLHGSTRFNTSDDGSGLGDPTMIYAPSIFRAEDKKGDKKTYLLFTTSRVNGVVVKLPIQNLKPDSNVFTYAAIDYPDPYLTNCDIEKVNLAKELGDDAGSGDYKDGLPTISPEGDRIAIVRVKRTTDSGGDPDSQKGARSVIIARWNKEVENFETKSTSTKNIIRKQIRSIVWVPARRNQ